MIDSKIGVVDAMDDAIVTLNGIADSLMYRASVEGDDMLSMLIRAASLQAERLMEASDWLKEAEGIR